VAAALAIFVVYTALAGNGVADLTPSSVAGHKGDVSLVGKVVGNPQQDAAYTTAGLRFQLKDIGPANAARVRVLYHGSVPDQFKNGADLVVEGTMRNGVFVAKRGSMITKCPDHYTPAKSSKT
jgi:cytochrome c-type biogenesis protein CcmE